jgi:uncharacterized membrane protein (DUF485 family)
MKLAKNRRYSALKNPFQGQNWVIKILRFFKYVVHIILKSFTAYSPCTQLGFSLQDIFFITYCDALGPFFISPVRRPF